MAGLFSEEDMRMWRIRNGLPAGGIKEFMSKVPDTSKILEPPLLPIQPLAIQPLAIPPIPQIKMVSSFVPAPAIQSKSEILISMDKDQFNIMMKQLTDHEKRIKKARDRVHNSSGKPAERRIPEVEFTAVIERNSNRETVKAYPLKVSQYN